MLNFKRLRLNENIRGLLAEVRLSLEDFIYPLFVVEGSGVKNIIPSMPEVFQLSIDMIVREVGELDALGIKHIMLFGVPDSKDARGSSALDDNHIVARAIRAIREVSDITISADLCLCEYTDHGHCGVLTPSGHVDNEATLPLLVEQGIILARAGASILAPSAMLDFQVKALRAGLDIAGLYDTLIMSYSTKFASGYYGPFRDVAGSAPSFGDRSSYQESHLNRREAIRESLTDEREGADILMVKPALAYLDVVRDIREASLLPLAVYNVSGEYAMLKMAGKLGLIDYDRVLLETMGCFKRAGADIIISYHAKELAQRFFKE